jgi:hypothetical protein
MIRVLVFPQNTFSMCSIVFIALISRDRAAQAVEAELA